MTTSTSDRPDPHGPCPGVTTDHRGRWSVLAAVILLAAGLTACGGDQEADAERPSRTATSATTDDGVDSTPADTPTSGTVENAQGDEGQADGRLTPQKPRGDAVPELGVMPEVVGRDLQWAQDTMQALDVSFADSYDATGDGRLQLHDANWVVVEQSPAPGTKLESSGDSEIFVEFGVVKWGEAGQPAEAPYIGTVPGVVCADLQYAQDTMQAHGYGNLESEEVGEASSGVDDRRRLVIDQRPASGREHEPGRRVLLVAAPTDQVEGC